jgi:ABC-type polysaccharide transport system permease subunit
MQSLNSDSSKVDSKERNLLKTNHKKKKNSREEYFTFLLAFPFIILTFLFSYLPLYGWIYAFFNFTPPLKLSQCEFVGLHWFKFLFANTTQVKTILHVLRNTFAISGLGILTSFLPIAFAIFLSEIKNPRFKKAVQTLTTLPNFISWVLVYSFAYAIFAYSGVFNTVLMDLHFIKAPITWLALDNHIWLSMTTWGIWKGLGWGAILYMAALAGIDQELYDAAKVDGAGRFRLMWHITVPGVLPTYFVLLMLSIAGFLNNGFDQYYVFQNAFNKEHIQVLDLYIYNVGFSSSASFSLATAISMLKSIVSLTLLAVVNLMSKLFRGESIV